MKTLAPPSDSRRLAVWCGALIVVLAYWNARSVLGFELLGWDDDINIWFNPHLGDLSWARLKWLFSDVSYMRRYIPLGWLGFSAVYGFSGLAATGYHAVNLVLHALNSLLLFVLVRQLLRRWSEELDSGWVTASAALAAGFWAWHPFRAETVGWASGLLYAWAAFFALLAVIVYSGGSGRAAKWRVPLAALLYLCALLTYPITLGCLGVFLLIDVVEVQRSPRARGASWWRDPVWRRLCLEKLLFVIPGLAVTAVNVIARYDSSEFWAKAPGLGDLSLFSRLMRSLYSLAYFSLKPWWPVNLTPAPTQVMNFNPGAAAPLLAAVFLVGVTAALAARPAWRRGALWCWLGYLAFYVPMLGVTEQLYFPCDRYTHLPLMVVSVAIGLTLVRVPREGRVMVMGAGLLVVGLLGFWQRAQFEVWRNTSTVLQCIMERTDNPSFAAFIAKREIKFLGQRGEFALATAALDAGRIRFPGDPAVAQAAAELARSQARQATLNSSRPVPEDFITAAELHHQVALAMVRAREFREAREHFESALALDRTFALARYNFAIAWALQGRAAEALCHYLVLERLEGDAVPSAARRRVLRLMAGAYRDEGRSDLAARCLERALREAGTEAETAALRAEWEIDRQAPSRPRD